MGMSRRRREKSECVNATHEGSKRRTRMLEPPIPDEVSYWLQSPEGEAFIDVYFSNGYRAGVEDVNCQADIDDAYQRGYGDALKCLPDAIADAYDTGWDDALKEIGQP
jgi:hypothetical protein